MATAQRDTREEKVLHPKIWDVTGFTIIISSVFHTQEGISVIVRVASYVFWHLKREEILCANKLDAPRVQNGQYLSKYQGFG